MTCNSVPSSRLVVPTLLLASLWATTASAQPVSFVARKDFPTGTAPQSVAPGDFNGDGSVDLAVANWISADVSVLLGNGDGSLRLPINYATGDSAAVSVAVGDLNQDGVLDLAVATAGQSSPMSDGGVALLLGNGDGTFQTAVNLGAGRNPSGVALSDLNGDGALDLAVANWSSWDVSVLLGNGDGSFQPALSFAAGEVPSSVTVGDFNADGVPDLAVTNYVGYDVSVLAGNGDGTFQAAQNFRTGAHPFSVAAGDVNGDAALDLVVANLGDGISTPPRGNVVVLLGDGAGSFQAPLSFAPNMQPRMVTIRDFNCDGALDVAAAGPGALLLLGNGDGTFQPPASYPSGADPWFLAATDLNNDGVLDLAVSNQGADTVSVLPGRGDGTFLQAPTLSTVSPPGSAAVGDFNGDGIGDVVVPETSTASLFLGNGDGTFQPRQSFALGASNANAIAAADLNGDGHLDVAVAHGPWEGTVSVVLGNGDGTFRSPVSYASGNLPVSVAAGDFNGDGAVDLVVANYGSRDIPGSTTVALLVGNGDGTFQNRTLFPAGQGIETLVVGDIDGDGNLDFALAQAESHNVLIGFGGGDATFQLTTFGMDLAPRGVALGDFNGDGALDLATANYWLASVNIRLNSGNRTFEPPQNVRPSRHGSSKLVVGDFNGDGVADIAAASATSHDVSVLTGNGDGTFQASLTFGGGTMPGLLTASDLNQDGRLDLVVPSEASTSVSILINDTILPPPPTFHELAVAKDGNGSGTVSSTSDPESWGQIFCGWTCTATYVSGTTVTLTAQADTGSTFAGWSGCDVVSGDVCTVSMSEARWVTATFVLQRFTLQVRKGTLGNGTVTSTSNPPSSGQINCGGTCSATYDWDALVTLTATPAFGNLFLGWSGCDASSGRTCTVRMTAARSVTATFAGLPLVPRLF